MDRDKVAITLAQLGRQGVCALIHLLENHSSYSIRAAAALGLGFTPLFSG